MDNNHQVAGKDMCVGEAGDLVRTKEIPMLFPPSSLDTKLEICGGQGPTKPRGYLRVGPIPLGVANGGRGKPELFGEKPTQARGPYLPSPQTSIGSVRGLPEELGKPSRLSRGPRSSPEVSGQPRSVRG